LIAEILPGIIELRQAIHADPELAFQEVNTSGRILTLINKLPGLKVRTQVAKTGIVATLDGEKTGPCIALRADMDALPIKEESNAPYASKNPGRAHSCGHDGHVACLVGAAMVLTRLRDKLTGPVKFIFQPAEEGGGGGGIMCEEGALENPKVDAIFALHGWPHLPLGTVGVRCGPAMASTDSLDIVIHGRGTHAAAPHNGVDPILVASHVVTALQSVVARQISPTESAVVTIGHIEGGTARNIIPEQVVLRGTIRTLNAQVRETTIAAVRRIIAQTSLAFGAEADVSIKTGYPVLVNHPAATAHIRQAAVEQLGADHFNDTIPVSLGGEDFAFFAQRIPAALWRLGISPPGGKAEPLHSPRFNFPDEALPIGIRMHVAIALNGWH
jgi:amidohydrolase